MDEQDLAGLLVFGTGRDRWDRYVSGEALGGLVVLPQEAAPTYVLGKFPLERYDDEGLRYDRWVTNFRVGDLAEETAAQLREYRLDGSRLGVVGLSSRSVGGGLGSVPYSLWADLLRRTPSTTYVDVAEAFELLALVKGKGEQALLRHAAGIGEAACHAFVDAAQVGARESEVTASALQAIVARGAWTLDPGIIVRSGPGAFAWSFPEWAFMGGGSRILSSGDLISGELFPTYSGFETQQQILVCLGPPSANIRRLTSVVEESQQVGLAMLRPGVRFAEVADAMRTVVLDAGCWSTGPVIQTVSPVMFNDGTHMDMEADPRAAMLPKLPSPVPRDGDFVLEPGVALAVQPNAIRNGDRVCLGGTVLIGESRAELLNIAPTKLHVRT